MHKKIGILLSGLVLFSSVSTTLSQTRTSSPFSRFGIGEINHGGFGRNNAMGGTGIGIRSSQHLNNLNPASYTAIDSLSFFFEVGVSGNRQTIKTGGGSQSFSDMNYDYFAFGFPISRKIGLSFGLKPASNAGYNFETIHNREANPTLQTAMGTGNFSNLYGGIAYKVSPALSVGAHASFWFGKIKHSSFHEFLADRTNTFTYGSKHEHHMSNLFLDFGVQHTTTLSENQKLVLGATFRPSLPVNAETTSIKSKGMDFTASENLFAFGDTLSYSYVSWGDESFKMPTSFGVGASYVIDGKLTLAADYSSQLWGENKFPDDYTQTANTSMMAFGAEFIPNERTATRYYQRIRFRAGAYYNEDYLMINGYQLRDFGMSFGLGLPLRRTNTSINVGLQMGSKGTAQTGQLSENYTRFTLNFTMHEFWFMKRRFE